MQKIFQTNFPQVKIIDFGTAKQLGPGEKVSHLNFFPPPNNLLILVLKVKVLCGTPEFVAPEVVNYDFISTGSGKILTI